MKIAVTRLFLLLIFGICFLIQFFVIAFSTMLTDGCGGGICEIGYILIIANVTGVTISLFGLSKIFRPITQDNIHHISKFSLAPIIGVVSQLIIIGMLILISSYF